METGDEIFGNKHALLDVNILSEMATSKRSDKFRPVFDFLKKVNASPYIIDATCFEFAGFSNNSVDYKYLIDWLNNFPIVPTRDEEIKLAILISSIYKCKNPSINKQQISYPDLLYAAQIIKYRGKAFLVTTNINDYPVFLFNIPKIISIEQDSGSVVIVGFMTFNLHKWEETREHFETSGPRKIN